VKFSTTPIPDLTVIDVETLDDSRGFFARTWCADEFGDAGLVGTPVQCSISFNKRRGTLRGLHFQAPPYSEVKIVRCTKGKIYDVAVDVRENSPTFLKWYAVLLSGDNHRSIFIPKGFAHGFQTLEDNSEVEYMISAKYSPEMSRTISFADKDIGIDWPVAPPIVSDRDLSAGAAKAVLGVMYARDF